MGTVSVPNPHLTTLDDDLFLIQQLADITCRPEAEVQVCWQNELRSVGTNVRQELAARRLPSYQWSVRLEEFYKQTDAFLFESLTWNLCGVKQQMRLWIADFLARAQPNGSRVLCYGDGVGFDSVYLTRAGHDVVYYEVSDRCQAFAAALFAKENTSVRASRSLDDFPAESFDAVVCLDVLEHLPDPPSLVARLAHLIRSDGHLIVNAPFFYLAPSVSTHLRSNRRYSGDWRRLYGTSKLRPVDGEMFWNPLALRKESHPSTRHAMDWRLRIGGWLLRVARWWPSPFVFVHQQLLSRADRRKLAKRADALTGYPVAEYG